MRFLPFVLFVELFFVLFTLLDSNIFFAKWTIVIHFHPHVDAVGVEKMVSIARHWANFFNGILTQRFKSFKTDAAFTLLYIVKFVWVKIKRY